MQITELQQGSKVGEVLIKLHEAQTAKIITTKAEAKQFLKKLL
jgi:hypothetical protein